MNRTSLALAALLALALAAVSPAIAAGASAGSSKPGAAGKVVVSIHPEAYFVDRISGGAFKPTVLVGPGQSPHSYEPTPRQMADLAGASAWMTIGAEFEAALKPKVAALYPKLKLVDTTVGIKYRQLEAHHHDEAEGERGREESGADIHVWLGRQASKTIAARIRDALCEIDPAGASAYKGNCDKLLGDIDSTFDGLAKRLAPLRGKRVFVYHPSFGYFFDEFGIEQEAVETGGKEPTQRALAALIEEAKADGAKVIFVQAQFPASAARSVASAIGGVVESIDPLAPDWLDNLARIGAALGKAVR